MGVCTSRPIRRKGGRVNGVQQWKPRETDGSVQQLLGPAGVSERAKSQTWVRLAISPGVVLDWTAPGRQGWAASVRSGSYRVVTVPHSAPCSPSAAVGRSGCVARPRPASPAVPATLDLTVRMSGTGLLVSRCLHLQQSDSSLASRDVNMPAQLLDGTVSLGNLGTTPKTSLLCRGRSALGVTGPREMTSFWLSLERCLGRGWAWGGR